MIRDVELHNVIPCHSEFQAGSFLADQCESLEDAECVDVSMKCKCNTGYKEVDSGDGTTSTCEKDKVSNVECIKDMESQCTQTENAECDNAETDAKCRCSMDYIEDPADDTSCIQVKVSDIDCAKDAEGQCTHTASAECNDANTNAKCQCSMDYIEEPSNGYTCVKMKVSNVDCTKEMEGLCTHTANAECNDADTYAKCRCSKGFRENPEDDSTCVRTIGSACSGMDTCVCVENTVCEDSKCTCNTGYAEKDDDCILTVSGTDCSDAGGGCENIGNSVCDADAGKCTCSPGYTMNVNECVGNNATSLKIGWLMWIVLCIIKVTD